MSERGAKGWAWLVLAGVLMITWGILQYIGIEWWPAFLIIAGVFLVIMGIAAARSKSALAFEKE